MCCNNRIVIGLLQMLAKHVILGRQCERISKVSIKVVAYISDHYGVQVSLHMTVTNVRVVYCIYASQK